MKKYDVFTVFYREKIVRYFIEKMTDIPYMIYLFKYKTHGKKIKVVKLGQAISLFLFASYPYSTIVVNVAL